MKHFYPFTVVLLLAVIMGGSIFAQNRPTPAYPATDGTLLNLGKHQSEVLSLPSALPREIFSVVSSCTDGGNRLVFMQNTDGGWGWPLTGASAPNTVGPIAMGLAQAYQQTGVVGQHTALSNAGAYLLTKINTFSPSDGYLAAQLDKIFGGTTYRTHVKTYFYDMLAAGTYDRGGLGTLYTTASYIDRIRTVRSGDQANMAAWDIGMGLVSAAMCEESTAEWIAGVKAEIDELDGSNYYDVIGLAGALYGLAFVGEEYDPVAGEHAAASNLSDLAVILAGYQISGGGFTWNSDYVATGNETNQETGYAILALNEVNRSLYLTNIQGAADFLMSVQLGTGGWDDYVGDPYGENNEITGEALWGICAAYPPPVHNVTKDVYYPTIQGAINDASNGDVINVAAGTYTEQVVINKNLTLSGTGNPMIKAPASPTGYTFTEGLTNIWDPVVFVFGGTLVGTAVSGTGQVTVNISGIIVDGNSRIPSPTSRRAVGILYRNALGGVEHSTVQNMGYSTTFANSWGIMAYGTSDVIFHGNTVSGYAKGGFVVNGVMGHPEMAKPNAVIDGNTVTGPPYDPLLVLAPNGIQIGWGATGSVTNNTATHHGSPGTVWGGTGILIQSSPNVLVEGNSATENMDYGIATSGYETDLSPVTGTIIRDNIIEGNGWGIYVSYRSVNTLIEDNQITGNEIGIRVGSSTAGYRMNTPPVNTDINNNLIYENITLGVEVATNTLQEEVDAEYNYWGSVHGPLDAIGTVEMPGNPSTPVANMKNTIPADKLGNAVSEKVDYYKWQGKNNPNASGGGIWAGGYVNPSSNDIFAGFDPSASDGVDLRDTVAPPPPPSDYLYLYFLLAPGQPLENYSYDVKKEEAILATAAKHWDLKALTDHTSELVTIEFPLTGLPDGFKPTLYDLATGKYQNLRDNPFYEYTSPATEVPSSFLILIGDSTKPTVSVTAPNGGEFLVVGQPYSITWSSSDGTGVLRHYIYWSSTGASPYTLIDSVNGNVYSYNWTPTLASNTASVKVTARDSVMNEETDISNNTFWILATNSASFSAIAGWNLVSIPLQQTDMSPAGVFGDDYAVPYYTFQYNASGGYSVPSTLIMGQGYWLGSNSAQVVDAVGTPLSTVDFALTNGFNIIGNPYVVSILKSDLRFTNGVYTKTMVEAATASWLSNVLYGYNGGYIVEGTTLGVWNGYWIPMLVSGITIQYRTGLGVPSPIAVPTLATDIAEGWGVDIGADLLVNGEKVSDHIASFGVNTKATAGFDPVFDAPRPPRSPYDRYVKVSFAVDGESYPNSAIGRDYRNSTEGGWEFLVTASHEGTVTLTWDNSTISQLPSDINVELNDVATGQVIDMKRTSSYSFDQTGTTRRFLINRDDKAVPVSFELIQNYPNPFNPTTKLQYGLPADADVKVVVFDYLGRQVAVLTDGFVKAGYHEVSFDASQLASGVYIYRLTAIGTNGTHFFDSKKMILAR